MAEVKKPVRVWVDGCFDMMHFGHANAVRQARLMGDYLVCGVHSDEDIFVNKGPTVMKNEERYRAARACKWVDEVAEGSPYTTQLDWLDRYNIDFVVHGDDISSTSDGQDAYHIVKVAGRYRECKRTPGISTTDLVERMLTNSKNHLQPRKNGIIIDSLDQQRLLDFSDWLNGQKTKIYHYVDTTKEILTFCEGKEPKPNDVIVYVDGTFDLFHVGHITFFEEAKRLGTFLIVGIHDDETVNKIKGGNNPIMNLQERTLGVLSCRYVDQVVIGAPFSTTLAMIDQLKINYVIHGMSGVANDIGDLDPYRFAKERGIYREVENPMSNLKASRIMERIMENRPIYEARNRKKVEKAQIENQILAKSKQ